MPTLAFLANPMRVARWLADWLTDKTSPEDVMLRYADSGKPELLDHLVQCNGKDLYHFLLSQTDPQQAADLSQSTWLKVIEKRSRYQSNGSFKSWLFTLGRHQMIDQIRQSQRWQTIEWDDDLLIGNDLSEAFNAKDELARFNALLDALPFLQKEAFMLQQEGFSLTEIARITGENSETIKSRLRYAKNSFKHAFKHSFKHSFKQQGENK